MRKQLWVAAAALLGIALPVTGPIAAQEVTFHGQVRPRYEFRDPSGGGQDDFTSMRVRVALEAALDPSVSLFIQLQDVRLWGEESSTLADFSADHLDLHQGYLRYRGQKLDWLSAMVGRQELNLGGQRLIGAVGWTPQGRSFDGVKLDVSDEWGVLSLIGFKLADETAPANESDAELYGAYATVQHVGPGALDLYWFYNRGEGALPSDEHSFGARYAFTGAWRGRIEGTLQRGDRGATDIAAYMFGARLGRGFAEGKAAATLWYDYLSGDDDPGDGETNVFSTLFATNHKFYGVADLFLNLPAHTGGAGLQDLALKLSYSPTARVRLAADAHSFRAARRGALSDSHFGDEIDLTLSHAYTPHLTLTSGVSFVLQDDAWAEIGRLDENMTFVYVMLNAIF